jgi:hypothetical protein
VHRAGVAGGRAHPEALAEYIDLFVVNLDVKVPILRWEAFCALGKLASVDRDGTTVL